VEAIPKRNEKTAMRTGQSGLDLAGASKLRVGIFDRIEEFPSSLM
jgi:hypothetical protein